MKNLEENVKRLDRISVFFINPLNASVALV